MSKVFISYSHKDEEQRNELESHLSLLKREGLISTWNDRKIKPGENFENEINTNLNSSDIILLLISHHFINSDYCYEAEMTRALEMHRKDNARIIPIILDYCDWKSAPFGQFLALPEDGSPVSEYPNPNKAYLEIVKGIRNVIEKRQNSTKRSDSDSPEIKPSFSPSLNVPKKDPHRSSNLRIKKQFSDKEKDDYTSATFEYIYKFISNSLEEMKSRNSFIDYNIDKVDSRKFTVKIYNEQKLVSQCTISLGDDFTGSQTILYSNSINSRSGFNEMVSVEDDGYQQFLRASGMSSVGRVGLAEQKLSKRGVADLFWDILIEPLQR